MSCERVSRPVPLSFVTPVPLSFVTRVCFEADASFSAYFFYKWIRASDFSNFPDWWFTGV